jgi:hypothetical protein
MRGPRVTSSSSRHCGEMHQQSVGKHAGVTSHMPHGYPAMPRTRASCHLIIVVASWRKHRASAVSGKARAGVGSRVPHGYPAAPRAQASCRLAVVVASWQARHGGRSVGNSAGGSSRAPRKNPATPCAQASCRLVVYLVVRGSRRLVVASLSPEEGRVLNASCAGLLSWSVRMHRAWWQSRTCGYCVGLPSPRCHRGEGGGEVVGGLRDPAAPRAQASCRLVVVVASW